MSAKILSIEPDVVRKLMNARRMLAQVRERFISAPEEAMNWAAASGFKLEEALELSRINGEQKLAQLHESYCAPEVKKPSLRLIC